MKKFYSVAELEMALGSRLGQSRTLRIDQDLVNGFAEVSGDKQWIHVDAERAESGPYGRTIAHGLLTLPVSQHLAHEVWDLTNRQTAALYGFNRVRFPTTLPVSSEIFVIVDLLEVEVTSELCKVITRVTTKSPDIEKPVCVSEPIVVFYL